MDKSDGMEKLKEILIKNNIKIYQESDEEQIKELGQGSYGKVFKSRIKGVEEEVAIKRMQEIDFENLNETIESIKSELGAMTKIEHKFIPKFYGVVCYGNSIGIILSFIPGITLKTYMTDNFKSMTNSLKCKIIIDLCDIIKDLHNVAVIHRDIKPENIMIHGNNIFLLDFGISKIAEKSIAFTAGCRSTPKYSAPENFDKDESETASITKKYDIWSIGCLISEIFSGVPPWKNKFQDDFKIIFNLNKKTKFPIPKEITDDKIKAILNKCLSIKFTDRPTCEEIISDMTKLYEEYLSLENNSKI